MKSQSGITLNFWLEKKSGTPWGFIFRKDMLICINNFRGHLCVNDFVTWQDLEEEYHNHQAHLTLKIFYLNLVWYTIILISIKDNLLYSKVWFSAYISTKITRLTIALLA